MKCIVCDGRGCEFCPRVKREYVAGGTALDIKLEEDENGYELHLTNEDGQVFTFNVHVAALQLVPIGLTIASYFREGEAAARSYVPPASAADLEGYDLGDPKRVTLERGW